MGKLEKRGNTVERDNVRKEGIQWKGRMSEKREWSGKGECQKRGNKVERKNVRKEGTELKGRMSEKKE